MIRVLKWLGYGLAGLAVLAVLALAVLYVGSERVMRRTYAAPLTTITLPTDSASIAEGKRLATLRGCYGGCHGTRLEGGLFFDEPGIARISAPNLTRMVREYDDAELERVIRRGITKDGRSVFAMPSPMFYHLNDRDLGRILAFLRSEPEAEGPPPEFRLGLVGRIGVALGQFPPLHTTIDTTVARIHPDTAADTLGCGRYLALTVCSECHGADLGGSPDGATPDLRIVGMYEEDGFERLMRTGVPLDGRELGLMKSVSLSRFQYLTDAEIGALHAYLRTLALAD